MPEFLEGTFDFVLDKGTIDAMMCGTDVASDVKSTMLEVYR